MADDLTEHMSLGLFARAAPATCAEAFLMNDASRVNEGRAPAETQITADGAKRKTSALMFNVPVQVCADTGVDGPDA